MKTTVVPEATKLIEQAVKDSVSIEAWQWLSEKNKALQTEINTTVLNTTFALVPRKTGHQAINISPASNQKLGELLNGFSIINWTVDRLCRSYILLQLPSMDKDVYCTKIETLFKAADMNELVALYSSLPLLAYPQYWVAQCAEGVRSNIGTVLEAIMYDNPYPSMYLEEIAWNQLILKAFFTDKDLNSIIGIEERNNKALADTLLEYAKERWSAGRHVNPQLWRFVAPFVNDASLPYLPKLLQSSDPVEVHAGALVCYASPYQPAKDLLSLYPELTGKIQAGTLDWKTIHAI